MNHLELVQELARSTGTLETADPLDSEITTLQDPTNNHLIDLIRWTRRAWNYIQLKSDWQFLIDEATVSASTETVDIEDSVADFRRLVPYTGRFRKRWIRVGDREPAFYVRPTQWAGRVSLYRTRPGRPKNFTVVGSEMKLFPEPDKAYDLTFEYLRKPQVLAADADVPVLPEEYHDLIVYCALIKYAGYDEANAQFQRAQIEYDRLITQMNREYLPEVRVVGAR